MVADAGVSGANDKEAFRPSAGKPVYYVIAGKKQLELGEVVAGVPMPDPSLVEREVIAALNSQGFVQAKVGGPLPTVGIMIVWGAGNFQEYEEAEDSAVTRDRVKMERISGALKWGAGPKSVRPNILPPATQQAAATTKTDRLYVAVSGVDVDALREKRVRLLWRTSMTIDWKHNLAEALPVMLTSAAPFFGREFADPVFIGDKERREARVEIGDLKVVPDGATPQTEESRNSAPRK